MHSQVALLSVAARTLYYVYYERHSIPRLSHGLSGAHHFREILDLQIVSAEKGSLCPEGTRRITISSR